MTVFDALVLRSAHQTVIIARTVVPARAAHMRQAGGAELRVALDDHLATNIASASDLSAFLLASGGQPISILRTAELVAAVVAAAESGRLHAYLFREPGYVSNADLQALRTKAEQAVRRSLALQPGSPPARPFAELGTSDRFIEVLRRTVPRVGPQMARQLREIVEDPAQLALMVATIVILAQLHAVAAGELIDGVVLTAIVACAVVEGMGIVQAMVAALEAVANLVDFIITTVGARDYADLDRAAEKLAAALGAIGVGILTAALARIAGRFRDSLKKAGGQRRIETVTKEEMAGKRAPKDDKISEPPPSQPSRSPQSLRERLIRAQNDTQENINNLRSEILSLTENERVSLIESIIDELDVSTERDKAVFYSGGTFMRDMVGGNLSNIRFASAREFAEASAISKGKTTLEMTPGGRLLDKLKIYPDKDEKFSIFTGKDAIKRADEFWSRVSSRYAHGASGEVEAILCNPAPDRIYMSRERNILINNKDVILKERYLDKFVEMHGL